MAKTLVVYYSQSRGNTKKIAREIASTLGADLTAGFICGGYSVAGLL